jgi:hypothetical protein
MGNMRRNRQLMQAESQKEMRSNKSEKHQTFSGRNFANWNRQQSDFDVFLSDQHQRVIGIIKERPRYNFNYERHLGGFQGDES